MTTRSKQATHPVIAARDAMDRIPHIWDTAEQLEAVRKVLTIAIPPLRPRKILRATTLLHLSEVIDNRSHRLVHRYIARAGTRLDPVFHVNKITYPMYFSVVDLYTEGRRHENQEKLAIQLFIDLARNTPHHSKFSPGMYYRHTLSFRHSCAYFWQFFEDIAFEDKNSFRLGLRDFIGQVSEHTYLKKNDRLKLRHTERILDGELLLGGVRPRGSAKRKGALRIFGEIQLEPEHLRSETRTNRIMSARTSQEIIDGSNVNVDVKFPHRSTPGDRHRIVREARYGFARTNVSTTADMNVCCLKVHRDFLIYAQRNVDKATFALIWIVAFLGLNHRRPLVERVPGYDAPRHDEILVCMEQCVVMYNIIRRRMKTSEGRFETCGRMILPVGQPIASGLVEIARSGNQNARVDAVDRDACKFSGRQTGQRPTLPRLRAGAGTHMKRLGFTDLEHAALRGRVPPAHFAISAYYPATVDGIVDSFQRVYRRAIAEWYLPQAFRFEIERSSPSHRGPIYCGRSRGKDFVEKLLEAIGALYEKRANAVRGERFALRVEPWIDALNAHELGSYVLQEMGLGLRPIGKVGNASAAGSRFGALTFDKGSRQFSERSFSIVSTVHENLLAVRAANRSFVRHALTNIAVPVRSAEPHSGLARLFQYDAKTGVVVANRMQAKEFRALEKTLFGILVSEDPPNALRHVSTEVLGLEIPRWQSDEHHGHNVIGRRAFGKWSTVSIPDFEPLALALESLHAELVPESLLRPIAPSGTWS